MYTVICAARRSPSRLRPFLLWALRTAVVAVLGSACLSPLRAGEPAAVAQWSFDGDLRDGSGHGNDAYAAAPQFVAGHRGQGLSTGAAPAAVSDRAELRLAAGLRIDVWVKLGALPTNGLYFLEKESDYMLRVDPASEGGHFAFFVYLDGWEPRLRSPAPVQPGVWYHLVAGWDGKELSLRVNDAEVRAPRSGVPAPSAAPLRIHLMDGVIDDLRVENPGALQAGVAHWAFDGDLRDDTGKGHDGSAAGARFAPAPSGQALGPDSRMEIPHRPDLQLAPGLRIDASVRFEALPTEYGTIAIKDRDYQLRVDSQQEGGRFSFFVNLDGWEPRVQSRVKAQAGVWYRLIAAWDGSVLSLEVNGESTQIGRSGLAQPGIAPLLIGTSGCLVDDLRIENPRLPVVRVRALTQEHAILRAGRPEKLTAVLQNLGRAAANTVATLELSAGVTCLGPGVHELGALAAGAVRSVEWTVQAEREVSTLAEVRLTAEDCKPPSTRRPLAFFPAQDRSAPFQVPPPAAGAVAVTHYIDSVAGDNANTGTSPESPWRDFTKVNGATLGPGERLLIKRGSVINQELSVSAQGTAQDWAEIGAYGSGPRPTIRRDGDIDDRCVLVRNPDFLLIRGLVVCYAGKGLVVQYQNSGHAGLVIEDCIAHHIEGLYRPNAHGIPEWRDRNGAAGDGLGSSAGIAIIGAQARDLVLRDCELFQCSWGFFVMGDALTVDRVFCHDNYAYNTSPHPAMVSVRRSTLQNSIFDAPGYHAFAGTMGIMLVDPQGLIIRNCTFRNQPDSGSHDEGGIDFENTGNGCLIDGCTFENNAGAAIEVLGLQAPQPRNVEIMNSRFIKNNVARKLGPAEIYIWGAQPNPEVCCSTGSVHDNGYVTNPGVEFWVNEAPQTTSWTLQNNTRYASADELRQAMPHNEPPVVKAGPDLRISGRTVRLAGSVSDDGRPDKSPLAARWEVLEGPGPVVFQDEHTPETTAEIAAPGDYLLRLVGDDGELWLSDMVVVHVLPVGMAVAAAWEFNTPLDKEGWTEVNPGTRQQEWLDQKWASRAEPVKYVAGGTYILAIDGSSDAHLLSPDNLGTDLTENTTLRIRFQNHTPARQMRLRFTTVADPAWDDAKSQNVAVVANDPAARDVAINLAAVPGWRGRLKQLRLDLATGSPLTGTCRFDYIWIVGKGAGGR
jgi:hypothetical protein